MQAPLKAGVSYFALVYLAGFVLGTARVLLVAPRVGDTAAVLIETPIILAASWIGSRLCIIRFSVPPEAAPRLAMGSVAFALLIIGELGVSNIVFGRSWEDALAAFLYPPGIIGLSAQVAFALLPLVQAVLERGRS
jgi:hypothetical protein